MNTNARRSMDEGKLMTKDQINTQIIVGDCVNMSE